MKSFSRIGLHTSPPRYAWLDLTLSPLTNAGKSSTGLASFPSEMKRMGEEAAVSSLFPQGKPGNEGSIR